MGHATAEDMVNIFENST